MGRRTRQAEGLQAVGWAGRRLSVAGSVCILQVEQTGLLRWGTAGAEGEARCAHLARCWAEPAQPLWRLQAGLGRAGCPCALVGV